MNNRELIKLIREITIWTVQETSHKIFFLSQQNVPEKSGKLKKSGSYTLISNGAEINYSAPHSAVVKFGRPERKIKGNQIINVKSHKRRGYLRKDGLKIAESVVPGYTVTYKNKRLIPLNIGGKTLFRVISKWPKLEGKLFLTRAIQEGFQSFIKDLRKNLKAGLK